MSTDGNSQARRVVFACRQLCLKFCLSHERAYNKMSIKYYELVSVFLPSCCCTRRSFFVSLNVLSVACLAVPYFPNYLMKGTTFGEKNIIEHKMCVSVSSAVLSETFLILRRIRRDIVINLNTSSSTRGYTVA